MFLNSIKEKYLILSIQVFVALILFLPFFTRSTFYFPFVVPRNIAFRIGVEIMALLYLVLVLKNPQYLPRKNNILIIWGVFLFSLTLSSILGADFKYSFWSDFERMDGLVALYHQFIFFLIVFCVFREKRIWEIFMQISLFAALIIALIGFGQYLKINLLLESSAGERITSTIGNPTYLAAYLLIHIFIALYFFIKNKEIQDLAVYKYGFIVLDIAIVIIHLSFSKSLATGFLQQIFSNPAFWILFVVLQTVAFSHFYIRKKKLDQELFLILNYFFYAIIIALFLFIITLTQTRGAIIGLGLGVFFSCLVMIFRKGAPKFIRIIAIVLIGLFIFGAVWLLNNRNHPFVARNPLLSRIASISSKDLTTQTRLLTWNAGFKGFLEKPIFGWGVENFYRVFNKYFPPGIYREPGSVVWYDRPHNLLIQYGIEGGGVGLIIYITFFSLLIMSLLRYARKDRVGIIFMALSIAYLGQNLFVFDTINSYLPYSFMLGFMLFLVTDIQKGEKESASMGIGKIYPWAHKNSLMIFSIAAIFTALALWYINIVPAKYNNAFYWQIRKITDTKPSHEDVINTFDLIDEAPYLGKFEIFAWIIETAKNFSQNKVFLDYEMSEIIKRAEKSIQGVFVIHPDDVRLYMLTMLYYVTTAVNDSIQNDKVIELREKAIDLSPTRAQLYLLTGRAIIAKKMYDKALLDFEKAVELAPGVFEPRWYLFKGYLTVNNKEKAEKEAAAIMKLLDQWSFQLEEYIGIASLFSFYGFYEEAEAFLLAGIKAHKDPPFYKQKATLYAKLADFYSQRGRIEEARETVRKAVEFDPSISEEAQEFLRSINSQE